MADHPILFSAEMVFAILEGRKTMTRRVIKPQVPADATDVFYWYHGEFPAEQCAKQGCWYWHPGGIVHHKACPYGEPGDRLWVKESWAVAKEYDHLPPSKLPRRELDRVWYIYDGEKPGEFGRTRSARFMPRCASRITLEIVGIRIQKLLEITDEDMIAEGIGALTEKQIDVHWNFIEFWDSINAKRGYGWDTNPWVWVIEFGRVAA